MSVNISSKSYMGKDRQMNKPTLPMRVGTGFFIAGCTLMSGCSLANDATLKKKAADTLKSQLTDADTAKIRDVRIVYVKSKEGSSVHGVCGSVNAKNAFGGYVGFKPFIYVADRGVSPAEAKRRANNQSNFWWQPGQVVVEKASEEGPFVSAICDSKNSIDDDALNLSWYEILQIVRSKQDNHK